MLCPTKAELSACLLGKIAEARAGALLAHAENCDACGMLLESLEQVSSDQVTDKLREQSKGFEVTNGCERMIDRSEIYVQGEYTDSETIVDVAATKKHLLQGTSVRDYEIVRPIGEGGMGAVFLARHKRLKRDVALKVLSLRRSGDREAQRRFEQEMTIVGKLQHPGIVRALDAGEDDGLQYLVMELIEGADLRQIVDALGPIPVADACEICRLAAIALNYAHEQNLIHRDVKPSNLMLQTNGTVKVMDLGLARFTDQHRSLTSTQQAMGSLDFMAPEQLRAAEVDHRADVYGLACTLHFLLMGEAPEKRRTASLMVSRTPKLESLRSILPPPLTKLLQHMLVADPIKRCASLADVADQLAPFCNRADLQQLSTKATNLVCGEGGNDGESITSEVGRVASKPRLSRRTAMGLLCAAAVASLLAVNRFGPFADGNTGGRGSLELSTLPCISSNVEPIREIPLFQIHEDAVRHAVYNEGTGQLICGSDDTSISVRDLPNQARIVRVCLFESPITKLHLIAETNQCVCVDAHGNVALLQLPSASINWKVDHTALGSRPSDVWTTRDGMVVLSSSHGVTLLSRSDGSIQEAAQGTTDFVRKPGVASAPIVDRLRVRGEKPRLVASLGADAMCVLDNNLTRVVNLDTLESEGYKHFVYAEHADTITCLLGFPEDFLFLTGDATGEIRLWHAPGRPRSDMLLSCATKMDSAELTFQIHRQHRWLRSDFSKSPEEVKFDDLLGEMRIETDIERNGLRHVLEYRVNPNAAE